MKLAVVLALAAVTATSIAQTKVTKADFGKLPDGSTVDVYTLADATLNVRIITFGARLISIEAPDKSGARTDVLLGYSDLAGYVADKSTYFGAVVGRYGNRIGKGQFTVDGHKYQVDTNNNGNTLHGGTIGWDRHLWSAKQVPGGVELTTISKDGEMGFPGTVTAHVTYTLAADKLRIAYAATTDKTTVLNLTNHAYFNLAGHGDVLGEVLTINADRYTPVDSGLIPSGPLASVVGTPFDFRKPTLIGARIDTPNDQLKIGGGYDHNWVLNLPHTLAKPAATLTDPSSGRVLKVFTTEPAVQFYSGNSIPGTFKGRSGELYVKHSGLCLETQHYPDSPNRPDFPSTTLRPGQTYRTTTIFELTTTK